MKRPGWLAFLFFVLILAGCKENYQKRFQRMAEQENASCPRRLNETIRMDSTRYDAVLNQMDYYYTLSGKLDDEAYIQENTSLFKRELQKEITNLAEMQEFLRYHTRFHVVCRSERDGKVLLDVSF